MFRGRQKNEHLSIPSVCGIQTHRVEHWLRPIIAVGILVLASGLSAYAQSENIEVVVWDTGPSIQGDDGAIVTISGPVSYEFYAGPDEDQSNPHPLYLPAGDYSFTVTAVWPQQPGIDGTSDECGWHGRCQNSDIATFYIDFRAYGSVPIAEDDTETTDEDTPVDVVVLDTTRRRPGSRSTDRRTRRSRSKPKRSVAPPDPTYAAATSATRKARRSISASRLRKPSSTSFGRERPPAAPRRSIPTARSLTPRRRSTAGPISSSTRSRTRTAPTPPR